MEVKIFSFAHKSVDYLDKLSQNVVPVGVGKNKFPNNWLDTNVGENINHKHFAYAEMAGQYWVWKNYILKNLNKDIWIGFSQYRRHWIKNHSLVDKLYYSSSANFFFKVFIRRLASSRVTFYNSYLRSIYQQYFHNTVAPPINIYDLSKNIFSEAPKTWNSYDVILTQPIFLGENIRDQYCTTAQVHSDCFDQIISRMPFNMQNDFNNYTRKNSNLSAHNMYIARPKVLNEFFSFLFNFYEKTEDIFNQEKKSKIIEIPRFYGHLNERISDFWFKNFKKFRTLPMRFLS